MKNALWALVFSIPIVLVVAGIIKCERDKVPKEQIPKDYVTQVLFTDGDVTVKRFHDCQGWHYYTTGENNGQVLQSIR